jgi:aspartyl/asparaginyl-tRNA synthetase
LSKFRVGCTVCGASETLAFSSFGTALAQIVIEDESIAESLSHYAAESVLRIEGLVTAVEQAPNGVEIHQAKVTMLSQRLSHPHSICFAQR